MADKIKDWIEQLVTIPRAFKHTKGRGFKHRSRTTSPSSTANWRPASSASAIATSRVVVQVSQGHDFPGRR